MRHLCDSVDVLYRASQSDRSHTAATALNDGSVLSTARQDGSLAFDVSRSGDLFKVFHQSDVGNHGSVHDMQADTIAGNGNAIFIRDTGSLATQRCVAGNGNVRVDSESRRLGSTQTDFFLNRPDCINVRIATE